MEETREQYNARMKRLAKRYGNQFAVRLDGEIGMIQLTRAQVIEQFANRVLSAAENGGGFVQVVTMNKLWSGGFPAIKLTAVPTGKPTPPRPNTRRSITVPSRTEIFRKPRK